MDRINILDLLKLAMYSCIPHTSRRVEEVPQNMFCISSTTENIIMEVTQKVLI